MVHTKRRRQGGIKRLREGKRRKAVVKADTGIALKYSGDRIVLGERMVE